VIRDRLTARLKEMGEAPDYQRLASEVLGIRGAPPELARRLVSQALVLEDRRDLWRQTGEEICRDAPPTPGVYVLKDADDRPLYVGKAINLRRRLRAHFSGRRWRAIRPEMARAVSAEWREVGSELEALLREGALIRELGLDAQLVNIQRNVDLATRAVPSSLVRDVIVVVPSVEEDSVELVAARTAGEWSIQRTRRNGADLAVHSRRLLRFFNARMRRGLDTDPLSPIVFSWLAGRGSAATRLDPHDTPGGNAARELARRLGALLRDERLFRERLEQC
jgi:predicted GIY-YIG superfamily endonuclease